MKIIESVYVEWLEETWGNVYDKPYIQGGGARHIIGKWEARSRWMQGNVPMVSLDIELDGRTPVKGWAKHRSDRDGRVNVYEPHATNPRGLDDSYRLHPLKSIVDREPNIRYA